MGLPTLFSQQGFYGRQLELEALGSAFKEGRAVILSGGAGSGKSRLASEYSHRADVKGFWTTAEVDVDSTLAGLAPALGVNVEGKDAAEIAGEVQRRLTVLPPEMLWVVDNLTDLEIANGLLNASGSVRLLITTRDSRRHLLPAAVAFHRVAPELTLFFFYVLSDLEGHHAFSETIEEHNQNVQTAREAGVLP